MADTIIKTTFQLRRGKSTTWTAKNPTLAEGEPGFETDTGLLKICRVSGTHWNDIPYFGGSAVVVTDNESITIVDGKVTMAGFDEAEVGQIPSKGVDGNLLWINPATGDGGIKRGYYYDGVFYSDISHTTPISPSLDYIYVDNSDAGVYIYNGSTYVHINETATAATDTTPGIMKLYDVTGSNTDGTMTQDAITDELDKKVEVSVDGENEILILD